MEPLPSTRVTQCIPHTEPFALEATDLPLVEPDVAPTGRSAESLTAAGASEALGLRLTEFVLERPFTSVYRAVNDSGQPSMLTVLVPDAPSSIQRAFSQSVRLQQALGQADTALGVTAVGVAAALLL
jgi:hypothetical protein